MFELAFAMQSPSTSAVHNPIRIQGRGRPSGSTASTSRNPSEFEHVQRQLEPPTRARRRCTRCYQYGHNSRTCRSNDGFSSAPMEAALPAPLPAPLSVSPLLPALPPLPPRLPSIHSFNPSFPYPTNPLPYTFDKQ